MTAVALPGDDLQRLSQSKCLSCSVKRGDGFPFGGASCNLLLVLLRYANAFSFFSALDFHHRLNVRICRGNRFSNNWKKQATVCCITVSGAAALIRVVLTSAFKALVLVWFSSLAEGFVHIQAALAAVYCSLRQ